jgi:hypothetical protein
VRAVRAGRDHCARSDAGRVGQVRAHRVLRSKPGPCAAGIVFLVDPQVGLQAVEVYPLNRGGGGGEGVETTGSPSVRDRIPIVWESCEFGEPMLNAVHLCIRLA